MIIHSIIYFVGNCNSYQELSLPNSDRYQFGVELTNAASCHYVTITSATGNFPNNQIWCNKILKQSFNQLCASNTAGNMTFGSKLLKVNSRKGHVHFASNCKWNWIPTSFSSGDNSTTSVCPDPSPSLLTTIPSMFKSSSLVASFLSSSSFHTTVDDNTFIMATPTSYFSSTYSTIPTLPSTSFLLEENSIYSSLQSQFTTGLMYSQTSARSSLTSPGASPSPTMLFCSASENGTWPMTPACTNATSIDCGNNSSHAKG